MPLERRQFRVLYRDFLYRIVDLELLSASGNLQKLMAHMVALLAAFSFVYSISVVPNFALSTLPAEKLTSAVSNQVEFLIALTMAVSAVLLLLAWNTILPERRDCLILSVMPVRIRTVFTAKVGAIATAAGIAILAVNVFTGLCFPFMVSGPRADLPTVVRCFAAYWVTMAASGAFVCASLIAVQGIAIQCCRHRTFQKISGFVQAAAFFSIAALFLLESTIEPGYLPSFWFFGLFQRLLGAEPAAYVPLAMRAVWGLAVASIVAGATFGLGYARTLQRIIEQPDILPQDRHHPAAVIGLSLVKRVFPNPLDRAVILFTARTVARSRQHRLLLAAYWGVGAGIALLYLKDVFRGAYTTVLWHIVGRLPDAVTWNRPSIPLVTASLVLLVFAVTGLRAAFALPMALRANWIFQITELEHAEEYFKAARHALYCLGALPVWIAASLFYFIAWPPLAALQHCIMLVLTGVLLVETSMKGFRKIPFACSYLPGKANLNVRLGMYAAVFLLLADRGVAIELWAMEDPTRFAVVFAMLTIAAYWVRRRARAFAAELHVRVQFEDVAGPIVSPLDLSSDTPQMFTATDPIEAELRFHVQMAASERQAEGEPAIVAHYAALRETGNLTLIKEEIRAVWRDTSLDALLQDTRMAIRRLMRSPLFTIAAVALITIGIGVNGSVFSLFRAVTQRPMPGVTATGLVSFGAAIDGREDDPGNSWPNYLDYAASSRTLRSVVARGFGRFALSAGKATYAVRGGLVTHNYFGALGVRLSLGRAFTESEYRDASTGLVAVISDRMWREQFDGAPDILGRGIALNGHPATIVGVAPPRFRGVQVAERQDVWVPILAYYRLENRERVLNDRSFRMVEIVGQLAAGATISDAQAEFDVISRRLENSFPEANRRFRVLMEPYSAIGAGVPPIRRVLSLLMIVASLLLLVISANVANLILCRSVARQHEMAVRKSLGAPLARVLGLMFTEGLVISTAAAAAGWCIATWTTPALLRLLQAPADISLNLSPDHTFTLYVLLLAVATTIVFTSLPALGAWRQDPLETLKSRESAVVPANKRLLTGLALFQLVASVVLLTGAGLVQRSSGALDAFDTGFKKDHLLFVTVDTAGAAKSAAENAVLLNELCVHLQGIPGIAAVSYAEYAPLGWNGMRFDHLRGDPSRTPVSSDYNVTGPSYVTVVGAPLRAGRDLKQTDGGGPPVAVINENLANALWPGRNAIGRILQIEDEGRSVEIVGVVSNASFSDIREEGRTNMLFLPFEQRPAGPGYVHFHVRYGGALKDVVPAIRSTIHDTNSKAPVVTIETADERLQSTLPLKWLASLLVTFAVGALVLAGIGLYSLVALGMARRTREFAIRIACGASPVHIWLEALRGGAALTAVGLTLGLGVSIVASHLIRVALFGVSTTDPMTYASVVGLLAATCFVACLFPAQRATKTDPAKVLRQE